MIYPVLYVAAILLIVVAWIVRGWSLKMHVEDWKERHANAVTTAQAAVRDLDLLARKHDALRTTLDDVSRDLDIANAERKKLDASRSGMIKNLRACRKRLNDAESENETLSQECESVIRTVGRLECLVREAELKIVDFQARLNIAERRCTVLHHDAEAIAWVVDVLSPMAARRGDDS